MDELTEFIQSNPDPRELKRALAVQMVRQDYTYYEIRDVLQVSVGFITKWKQRYKQHGLAGLQLRHQGSTGYLKAEQRQAVLGWLQQKNYWNLGELQQQLEEKYEVVFKSNQSYYALFAQAGLSWKKTQKRNPKADPEEVEKKSRTLRRGWIDTDQRLSLVNWLSSSRTNAICCGETCVGMCGARRASGLKSQ